MTIPVERSVIHMNVVDFAAAVERAADPRLAGRPLAVPSGPGPRAVVRDLSHEASREGVHRGMALARARAVCPGLLLAGPSPVLYRRAMERLVEAALPFSPLVERPDDNGHLFIDATGTGRLFGPACDVAWRLRKEARAALGLDPVWSVAPSKLVAKVATRLVKPDGECIVEPGDEASTLEPVPIELLPGLEPDEVALLRELQLLRAGETARLPLGRLEVALGPRAAAVQAAARGIDGSPVLPAGQTAPRIELECLTPVDAAGPEPLAPTVRALAGIAAVRLRERLLAARRLTLGLEYADGVRVARRGRLDPPACSGARLSESAARLLAAACTRRTRVGRLWLACDRLLFPPPPQLELFPDDRRRAERQAGLERALDAIRTRFGDGTLRAGPPPAATIR